MITYLKHREIDKQKWDNCMDESINSLIYGYSWFLDVVSPNWDALVLGDYEAVMPLTWSNKFGIFYILQPLFVQQLGIFSTHDSDEKLVQSFISGIPGKFRYFYIKLNSFNKISPSQPIKLIQNQNFEIDLSHDFDILRKNYSRNCNRNILKAENSGLVLKTNEISVQEFALFIKVNIGEEVDELSEKSYILLENMLIAGYKKQSCEIISVSNSTNEILAAGSFFLTKNRCIFSVCASTPMGKRAQAMYFLVNHQLQKYSGKNMIFDFAGSNIPGVAYFNSTFGSEIKHYSSIVQKPVTLAN
ncbi:MAG: hypothetical protein HC906_16880 [Bacteroidales bacterium]|nr:hypothetical protein [Bacteroidales bacterium]